MLSCPKCSHEAPAGARFCAMCGSPLTVASDDAERRHLTVLFCDLVDSTRIAHGLDPEDWRDAVAEFNEAVGAVVARYDGYVAQFLGDGVVAYFGYPQAHEDDVSRGVRAGLGIVDCVRELNERAPRSRGFAFAVRVGLHVGPTVVGVVGEDTHREAMAIGTTMNIAARLQAEAPSGGVAVSEVVRRRTAGEFVTQDLGPRVLKGLADPMRVHVVLQPSGVRSRLDMAERLTPLIGRTHELGLLVDCWERVREGAGQVVLISGEAGVGKSRLALALRERLGAEPHTWLECRASPYTANAAFAPVVELVQQVAGFIATDGSEEKLARLRRRAGGDGLPADELAQLVGPLLQLAMPEESSPATRSPEERRTRTIELLVEWVLAVGRQQPVLLLVEDLHWCDPSTIDVLDRLITRIPTAPIMVVLTARPSFDVTWRSNFSLVTLNRLSRRDALSMLDRLCDQDALPAATVEEIVTRADGIPLWVEELAKMVLEARAVPLPGRGAATEQQTGGRAIPETLQDSLMARLDHLGPAKEVARLAAVIGREFPQQLLERVTDATPDSLREGLDRLVAAGIVFARGIGGDVRYLFKHALIRDAAYDSLLRSERRRYHHRIAERLRHDFPNLAQAHPEVVAQHYTEAERPAEAIEFWTRAGRGALECFANREAITHLQNGLALVERLPDGPERLRVELELELALGPPLMATMGYGHPLVEHAYGRALTLCRQLGERPEVFPVLFGLWTYNCVRANHEVATSLAADMTRMAESLGDPGLLLEADVAAGITDFYLGRFAESRVRLTRANTLYEPERDAAHRFIYGQDPRSAALAHLMPCLWMLGEFDAALEASRRAVELACTVGHPFSAAFALSYAALFHGLRGDMNTRKALAEEALALSQQHGLAAFIALAGILRGSALIALTEQQEGLSVLHQALDVYATTGSALSSSYYSILRANAYAESGRIDEARAAIEAGLTAVESAQERFAEAELYRTRAILGRAAGIADAAIEADFRRAIEIARQQGAKTWALHAAIGLAKHHEALGARTDATTILADVRGEFDSGLVAPELEEADRLLAGTARSRSAQLAD